MKEKLGRTIRDCRNLQAAVENLREAHHPQMGAYVGVDVHLAITSLHKAIAKLEQEIGHEVMAAEDPWKWLGA